MTAGRVRAALAATAVLGLAGCAQGSHDRAPQARLLPLVPGSKIVAQSTQCDRGSSAYCALELVVVNPRYKTSVDLLAAEHKLIHARGWNGVTGDTGDENAAESPGRKYRVTYGLPDGDLRSIELGYIHRSRAIAYALSRTLFEHTPAMSVMLETGSA
jgi:hypothetical protein